MTAAVRVMRPGRAGARANLATTPNAVATTTAVRTMNFVLSSVLATVAASVPFALPALALDTPADGYELSALAYPASGSVATLSNGDFVLFDGSTIDRYDASGAFQQNLVTLGGFVFSSFLILDPSETFVVAGESSNQEIFKVDLATGVKTPLTTLTFNYDAQFESANTIVVSASAGGFGAPNEIHRVNTDTGASTLLATVAGPSGPVCVDAAGNVFYGTVDSSFPPPVGSTDVLRWSAAALTGTPVLDESDAVVSGSGFNGAGDLVCDPSTGDVFLAENDFATGSNVIFRVGATRATSEQLVDGSTFFTIGNLEFVGATGGAIFGPYQPDFGGTLRYTTTDFGGTNDRNRVRPDRPEVTLAGPGAIGSGPFSVNLSGAPAGGVAVFVFGAQSLYSPVELPYFFGGQPVLSGFDVATSIVGPIVGTSGSGTASLSYFNNGTLGGSAVIQAICADPLLGLVGSSTTAFL